MSILTLMLRLGVRWPLLWFLHFTGRLEPLIRRMNYTEIGFSGHVSLIDEDIAKQHKLKKLNKVERWLLSPIIEEERKFRRATFRDAVKKVTGEDIEFQEDT